MLTERQLEVVVAFFEARKDAAQGVVGKEDKGEAAANLTAEAFRAFLRRFCEMQGWTNVSCPV